MSTSGIFSVTSFISGYELLGLTTAFSPEETSCCGVRVFCRVKLRLTFYWEPTSRTTFSLCPT